MSQQGQFGEVDLVDLYMPGILSPCNDILNLFSVHTFKMCLEFDFL